MTAARRNAVLEGKCPKQLEGDCRVLALDFRGQVQVPGVWVWAFGAARAGPIREERKVMERSVVILERQCPCASSHWLVGQLAADAIRVGTSYLWFCRGQTLKRGI